MVNRLFMPTHSSPRSHSYSYSYSHSYSYSLSCSYAPACQFLRDGRREEESKSTSAGTNIGSGVTDGGFTLAEIMVVLTIMVILLSAVVPLYLTSHRFVRIDQAERDLVATMEYAQERAVLDQTEYRLYLDTKSNTYWPARLADVRNGDKLFEDLDETGAGHTTLPPGLRFTKSKARRDPVRNIQYVAFFPSGACDDATIELETDKREKSHVATKGMLGRLEIARNR